MQTLIGVAARVVRHPRQHSALGLAGFSLNLQPAQEMRLYYQFPDVDVDRYMVDGQYRQVMLTAREIDIERQPVKTWS